MTKPLTIIARIELKKNKVDLVKSELLKLIEPTRKEQGCLQYDLHQDNENPAIFMFYENWENRELWQTHMNNEHLKASICRKKCRPQKIRSFNYSPKLAVERTPQSRTGYNIGNESGCSLWSNH